MFKTAPNGTAYELHGSEEAPAVVLIHGLGLCRKLWADHLAAFTKDYRVVNYDLYGHGDSSPPPRTATLSVYATQLSELMEHLDIPAASIVGFSIGGMINRRFAMDYPEKVTALAILNSPHDRGEEAQIMVEERAKKVREQGGMATFDEALKRWFTPDYREHGEGAELVRQWREQVDPEGYAQTAWVLANGVRELITPEEKIEKPCLVLTCENDSGSTPQMSVDIGAEIDGSEVVIIPKLQHLGLMEEPDAFTDPVIKFLERNLS